MATDVFISYRRKDLEFVTQLHKELTERGISAWFDMENIGVATHWRTEIAEGIRDCKLFILVLSPDAVESRNIRKEVDLAEDHGKPIIPLIWRETEIPAAFDYSLAGVQWIVFNEVTSVENFDQLAGVVTRMMGGLAMEEAVGETSIAVELTIPAVPEEEPAAADSGGRRRLGGRRKLGGGRKIKSQTKQNPLAIYGKVVSKVITAADLKLDPEDEDFLNDELKWLFNATNHLYRVGREEAGLDEPIPIEIPEDTERAEDADNTILPHYRDLSLINEAVKDLDSSLDGINGHLKNLELLVSREVSGGEEAKRNVNFQHQIKEQRLEIIGLLQQMASTTDFYFDVKVGVPRDLKELLQE